MIFRGSNHHASQAFALLRGIHGQHSEVATLAMEFEFEASALLALRHATEAYRKARPEAA